VTGGFRAFWLLINIYHIKTIQHTAIHYNTLQHTATHCNTLQHTTTHCNTPQHTATHFNTLHATLFGYMHQNDVHTENVIYLFVRLCFTLQTRNEKEKSSKCNHCMAFLRQKWNQSSFNAVHNTEECNMSHCTPYNTLPRTATHNNTLHVRVNWHA